MEKENDVARQQKIRLLVEENGLKLWRTVDGTLLVGMDHEGDACIGKRISREGPPWSDTEWFLVHASNGKFVLYWREGVTGPGKIRVFESVEALEAGIPPDIFNVAAKKLGIRPDTDYPELPLDL